MHIVVIDKKSGKIDFAKVFDTYESGEKLDEFIDEHGCRETGKIIVAACKDDCITKLSKMAKKWFESMGSKDIRFLEYREGFSFIGVTGEIAGREKRASNPENQSSLSLTF